MLYSDLLTFAVSCTVSELQAVLVLKTTFLFKPHLYLTLNLKVIPWDYGDEIWHQKTRIMGLSCGEEIALVGRSMWAQCISVTARQTDRQIDLRFLRPRYA